MTARFSPTEYFQLPIEQEIHEPVYTIWWSEMRLALPK